MLHKDYYRECSVEKIPAVNLKDLRAKIGGKPAVVK
jgi:hypothetical protein